MVQSHLSPDHKAAHVLQGACLLEAGDGEKELHRCWREAWHTGTQEVEESAVSRVLHSLFNKFHDGRAAVGGGL